MQYSRILEWVAVPSPGDLPDPGIKPASLVSRALAGGFFTASTWEAKLKVWEMLNLENTKYTATISKYMEEIGDKE